MTKDSTISIHKNSDLTFVNFLIKHLQYNSIKFVGNNVSTDDFEQILESFNKSHSSDSFFDDSLPMVGLLNQPYVINYSYFSALLKNIIMVFNLGISDKCITVPCYFDSEISTNRVLYSNKMTNKLDNSDIFLIYHIIFYLFLQEEEKTDPDYCELLSSFEILKDFYNFLDEKTSFLVKQSNNCNNLSCMETVKLLINIKDNKQIYYPLDNMDRSLTTFNNF